MKLVFSKEAWDDDQHWLGADPKTFQRLNELIADCARSPFMGIGKPEPLKGALQGWWSRWLTQSDRLVYRVEGKSGEQRLEIAPCRFHY